MQQVIEKVIEQSGVDIGTDEQGWLMDNLSDLHTELLEIREGVWSIGDALSEGGPYTKPEMNESYSRGLGAAAKSVSRHIQEVADKIEGLTDVGSTR